ncbi:MAG: glycosyltransferase family 4 protein [Sulfuricella sp.]|nr:glycosyltransferase family 4 protein [Sulfuricella sp.]
MNSALFAPLLAFVVTWATIAGLLHSGLARLAMDDPNHRSLHSSAIPRTGGIALLAGLLTGWLTIHPDWLWLPMGLGLILAGVSFLDDLAGLAVRWRLLAHLACAAVLAAVGLGDYPLWVAVVATLAIVWMSNLYNFMDGSDGLAGGMALFGFGFLGVAAFLAGDADFALAAWSVAATAAGFLLFNFHPARIFMGDAGSIPLGFFAAALGLLGWQRGLWPWWFAPLAFSPFVADASITLAKRGLRGEKVWQAHREHYYQRLVQMGLGHRTTALFEYALMLAVGASALWGRSQEALPQYGLLAAWAIVYGLAMRRIDIEWQRHIYTDKNENQA